MDASIADIGNQVMQLYQENKKLVDAVGIGAAATITITGLTVGYVKLQDMYKKWEQKRLAKLPFEERCRRIAASSRESYFRYED